MDGIPQAANDRSYHSPEKHTIAPKARFRGCGRNSTKSQWQILPQPRKAHNCSKSSFSGLRTEFHKQPMTDPTTAPKSTQSLQKLVFGAVDGIPKAISDRFYHSPEKHTIAPKARFRGCGRNSTSSQWQILPQPRKANNCCKSSFSGLWTEFHKKPMTDPTTAPKSTQLLQKLIFGAVDGIPQAANDRSYHSPEKHIIAPKALFRGCGRNSTSSQWQILPQPRKAHNCSKSSFSGLWTEFHKKPMTDPTTAPKSTQLLQKLVFGAADGIPQAANDRSHHSPEKHTIAPKARFRGCGRNSKSNQWQILPQPRKAHNCSKSSFSGLWTEFHKQPMTDPATAPKSKELLQKLIFGAVDGIPQAANDRSYHSPEKHTIAPKAFFRGCGRNSTSSQWQILPQPRKAHNCSKSSFSGLRTEFHKQPMTDPTTAPKNTQSLQKLVFGAVDGIPQAANDRSYHSPEKHTIAPKARFGLWTEFHKQPMTDPTTAPKSTQLLHKIVFGAVDGILQAANDRSHHSPEKQRIASKARFRGCGCNSTSSQWQILPQPRKAHNCSKSSFSGLWTEFHKQPMTDPATAPKSKQLLQKLIFGAVDGIPQAANDRSYHSPEKHIIAPKALFRGCGRNSTSSQWQILPQPRKAHNCSKSSFSGCGRNSTSSQWQILPQPRKAHNCSKSSFGGCRWTEFHKQPMTHFGWQMCFAPQRRAIVHLSSGQLAPHPPL